MSKLVKIAYLILLLALLIHPHISTEHIFPIQPSYMQSLINLLLAAIAVGIYFFHQRDIKHRDEEKKSMQTELIASSQKLSGAFKYIGQVNRRLSLLKNLTSDLLIRFGPSKKSKKDILSDLLATAVVSIAKTNWGIIRFLNIDSENTIKEIVYAERSRDLPGFRISNKDLIKYSHTAAQPMNNLYVVATLDRKTSIRCFIILPALDLADSDTTILQAIVDQAQLFYQYLFCRQH